MQLIGREREIEELTKLNESNQAEFVALFGRRRVGKTYLVRMFFNDSFSFYATGLARANRKEQIANFYKSLCEYSKTPPREPKDWYEAFDILKQIISASRKRRKVVFLDELPWMDTQKSEFLKALELFWNSWGCMQQHLLFIICGSAASWMVKNIIRNKGGLHNRLTCQMRLEPFNLAETKQYLRSQNIRWDEETIAEIYMIMGGIPYYLHLLDKSKSPAQNIDRLFFAPSALLGEEFRNLFSSLFKKSEEYEKIISTLNKKRLGYSRDELAKACKMTNGGGLSRRLEELEQCGFIRRYQPLNARQSLYQLVDFYCLFYFMFIHNSQHFDQSMWQHIQATPRYNNWLGLGFERLCFAHIYQIQQALGISGIATKTYAYTTASAQMDMVIERADKVISLCEMKYSQLPYELTKQESEKLRKREDKLLELIPTHRQVLISLVSNRYPKKNIHYNELITNSITIKDLLK